MLRRTKRELDQAAAALRQPGSGSIANLECRLADLQQRFLATPACTLEDVEVRLAAMRDLIAGLGARGYLLDLAEATLADLRALVAVERQTRQVEPPSHTAD
jgi:hypothetical protein